MQVDALQTGMPSGTFLLQFYNRIDGNGASLSAPFQVALLYPPIDRALFNLKIRSSFETGDNRVLIWILNLSYYRLFHSGT